VWPNVSSPSLLPTTWHSFRLIRDPLKHVGDEISKPVGMTPAAIDTPRARSFPEGVGSGEGGREGTCTRLPQSLPSNSLASPRFIRADVHLTRGKHRILYGRGHQAVPPGARTHP